MKVHFTDAYILNPQHKVTVNLIGLGGTGSQVLTGLARLNEALASFGHPGLHVYAYDGDTVSPANVGRQAFSASDIGINKAIVLMTRLNRFYGYEWEAKPVMYAGRHLTNITITCVDTAATRLDIGTDLLQKQKKVEPTNRPIYWLDFGNSKRTGQVVLGTVYPVAQPKKSKFDCVDTLPTVVKKFPQLKRIKEKDQGPSCSLAEAINKQDLFINPALADRGLNMLWRLFREAMLSYHGIFLNLETEISNPMKL